MVVPRPGRERTARVPPCAASRSDMPWRHLTSSKWLWKGRPGMS